MLPLSTARETIGRLDALIDRLEDAENRSRLTTVRKHMWGEMVNDLDMIMETMSNGPVHYTFGGHDFLRFGADELTSLENVRQMYAGTMEAGLVMSGGIDMHEISFGENTLVHRGIATLVFPGAALNLDEIDPAGYYLVRWWLMASLPFDDQNLIAGEHLLNGKPLLVHPVDRDAAKLLLDGHFPEEWQI